MTADRSGEREAGRPATVAGPPDESGQIPGPGQIPGLDAAIGPNRPLTVVIAPDSFKGSLTSVEVARALATGWGRARPHDRVETIPLADGGEGTLAAIEASGGWEWREVEATDPIGRLVRARWLRRADGGAAAVEMAEASGLSRLTAAERDPAGATTLGTGEVLRAVLDDGVRHVVLGIGGSATSDGAAGMLRALGADVELGPAMTGATETDTTETGAAAASSSTVRVDLSGLDPRLAEVELRIACDVTNPLLGPHGAAATYGPQKGATPDDVTALDARLARYADALEAATGRVERETPGAGAAGGVGFGLLCLSDRFRSLELVPGVDLVMEETGLMARLSEADLVISGEGRVDAQTAFGKTALGVARRAQAAGVPCIVVGGGVTPDGIRALGEIGATVVPVSEGPGSVESAMAAGPAPVERCGERIARLVSLGRALA